MTARMYVDFEMCGDAAVKQRVLFHPKDNQFWRVDLWAKQGSFKRERIINCDDRMSIGEFMEFVSAESVEFMAWFVDELAGHKDYLRLSGKFAAAYGLDAKPMRYGYRAFVETRDENQVREV